MDISQVINKIVENCSKVLWNKDIIVEIAKQVWDDMGM